MNIDELAKEIEQLSKLDCEPQTKREIQRQKIVDFAKSCVDKVVLDFMADDVEGEFLMTEVIDRLWSSLKLRSQHRLLAKDLGV